MLKVAHIGVVVRSIDEAVPIYAQGLGLHVEKVHENKAQRIKLAFLPLESGDLEFLEPTDETSGVAKFLASRGEGIHHICLEVEDIRASMAQLAAAGAEMIDKEPRSGAEGLIAFIHPKSMHGVLLELLQRHA